MDVAGQNQNAVEHSDRADNAPRHPSTALLLVNRKARSGKRGIDELCGKLSAGGLQLIEAHCQRAQELSDVIRQHRDRVDCVIIGGGDGTIHHALSGLIETKLPLGILPLGTANDLARTLKLPTDPLAACDVILKGQIANIDVGVVNGKHFCNVASIGLAVQITRRLNGPNKGRWGILAYVFAALQSLMQSRPFPVGIRCDGTSLEARTIQVTVGNGTYYGGGLKVDESASAQDGLLHLYSLEVKHWWNLIPLFPALHSGVLAPLPNVRTLQGTEIEIERRNGTRTIVADGEIVGTTPGHFHVLPRALSVFSSL